MTREERRAHWHGIIEDQATSAMSMSAYCRNAQINPSYFYTRRRRLREQQSCAGGFLELIPGRQGLRNIFRYHLVKEHRRQFSPIAAYYSI
jgi:hypothetical protein